MCLCHWARKTELTQLKLEAASLEAVTQCIILASTVQSHWNLFCLCLACFTLPETAPGVSLEMPLHGSNAYQTQPLASAEPSATNLVRMARALHKHLWRDAGRSLSSFFMSIRPVSRSQPVDIQQPSPESQCSVQWAKLFGGFGRAQGIWTSSLCVLHIVIVDTTVINAYSYTYYNTILITGQNMPEPRQQKKMCFWLKICSLLKWLWETPGVTGHDSSRVD